MRHGPMLLYMRFPAIKTTPPIAYMGPWWGVGHFDMEPLFSLFSSIGNPLNPTIFFSEKRLPNRAGGDEGRPYLSCPHTSHTHGCRGSGPLSTCGSQRIFVLCPPPMNVCHILFNPIRAISDVTFFTFFQKKVFLGTKMGCFLLQYPIFPCFPYRNSIGDP